MSATSKLIYVVDDELNIRNLISQYLIKEGYEVKSFENGADAFKAFESIKPDMIITDVMMPVMDGFALCKEIRKISNVPILMVSAKDDEIDKIIGLEIGSDDYISKPFSPRELVARVRTVFRRAADQGQTTIDSAQKISVADIEILIDEHKVLRGSTEIVFTSKEFALLVLLGTNVNKVFNRDALISKIWGYDYVGDTRVVDDLIKRVRKKLSSNGSELEIATVWGYGYKIVGK